METDLRRWIRLCETNLSHDIWFHGTPRKFDAFSDAFTRGQLGIHLGTRDQAEWRLGDETGFILTVRTSATNLIRLHDLGGWYGSAFVEQLKANPATNSVKWNSSMSDRHIRSMLKNIGYEGVIYKNAHEGEERSDSIIVFDASKLQILKADRWDGSSS